MEGKNMNKKIFIFPTIAILLLVSLLIPRITIYKGAEEKAFFSRFIFPGQRFVFKYHHSVEKTPVHEIYNVAWNGTIIMDKTKFQSYGAGLPLQTKNFSKQGNYFVIENMNIKLPEVIIRISKTPNQTVTVVNKRIVLNDVGKVGEKITIRVKPLYKKILFNNK